MMSSCTQTVIVRWLGRKPYHTTWEAMKVFTDQRQEDTPDEIWFLEHDPVFTQGQNGKPEHILNPGDIPVIQTDRGGQVTYHGPGQLMAYILIDVKRKKLNVRQLVSAIEQSVIDLLKDQNLIAHAKPEAPGIYVKEGSLEKKICSIGLRIRRGCSFHGIALNVGTDLEPFQRINPCGYANMQMTKLSELCDLKDPLKTGQQLINYLMKNLGYTTANY